MTDIGKRAQAAITASLSASLSPWLPHARPASEDFSRRSI